MTALPRPSLALLLTALAASCASSKSASSAPARWDEMPPAGAPSTSPRTSERGETDRSGLYAKLQGGLGLLESAAVDVTDAGTLTPGEADFDPGFLAGAALGYRFDDHWALEAEFAYRTNDLDSYSSSGSLSAQGGDFASTALMLNAYYHFGTDWLLDPYVGVGFGSASEIDLDLSGGSFGAGQSFSGDSPAAQYMLGAEGRLTDHLGFFLEGRFFRAFDPALSAEGGSGSIESEYGQLSAVAGLSWRF